jgi:hypothetical protein
MADVRRYEGLWVFVRQNNTYADFSLPLTSYQFEKQNRIFPNLDPYVTTKGECFRAVPVLWPDEPDVLPPRFAALLPRSPCPDAARG